MDTLASNNNANVFAPVVIEPPLSEVPSGTAISMAYRGASNITSNTNQSWTNANNLSPYGDSYTSAQHQKLQGNQQANFTVTWYPTAGDQTWTTDINDLDGARFVQARITLISNPETQLTPVLSALGFAYTNYIGVEGL